MLEAPGAARIDWEDHSTYFRPLPRVTVQALASFSAHWLYCSLFRAFLALTAQTGSSQPAKVHDMITLDGTAGVLDDAGVSGLAAGVQGPLGKGVHIAGVRRDILEQPAVGSRAGVSAVLLGQLGKGVLSGIAGLPLGQQFLRLGLCLLILLFGGGDVGVGGADQDVAHIGGGGVIPYTVVEEGYAVVIASRCCRRHIPPK